MKAQQSLVFRDKISHTLLKRFMLPQLKIYSCPFWTSFLFHKVFCSIDTVLFRFFFCLFILRFLPKFQQTESNSDVSCPDQLLDLVHCSGQIRVLKKYIWSWTFEKTVFFIFSSVIFVPLLEWSYRNIKAKEGLLINIRSGSQIWNGIYYVDSARRTDNIIGLQ